MESVIESPLDVLSRAATMVQRDSSALHGAESSPGVPARDPIPPRTPDPVPHPAPPHPPPARCAKDGRRQQRHSTAAAAAAQLYLLVPLSVRAPPSARRVGPREEEDDEEEVEGARPLDMRQPQPPPPPQQYLRPSVITCAPSRCPPSPPHPRVAQASSGDDPDIDEHFRRSLGSDYAHLFASGGNRLWPPTTPPTDNSLTIKITGNSVDDHFAKALGETWKKLQEEQQQGDGGAARETSPHPSSSPRTSPSGTWLPVAAPVSSPAASRRECSTSRGGERRHSAD